MTDRVMGRHRASQRASTPLSSLISSTSSAMTDHGRALGRGGAVIAMSSGLVASMGLPANAVALSPADAGSPRTASLPLMPAAPASGSFLALPPALDVDSPVTASQSATLSFDSGADFKALPQAPRPAAPVITVSRSQVRAALSQVQVSRAAQTTYRSSGSSGSSTSTVRSTPVGGGFGSARGSSVIAIASRYLGVPYVYGGESPNGFDCSGLVQYVFGQLGVSVPRTAQQQYDAATIISRSQAGPGDLVFFGYPNGGIYHVAIYLGGDMMIDAPHTGASVERTSIWSSSVSFGRL